MVGAEEPDELTFLFTDVEGSTSLWETVPDAMGQALARHDDLLLEIFGRADGEVFATGGDAFCVAFADPTSAVVAALLGQSALRDEPWPVDAEIRVRMGVHTGSPERRRGDYFGPPLNRCARLMSAGHGGQVLVSETTRALTSSALSNHAWTDHGVHRLRGLARPEHIWQVDAPNRVRAHPPLRTEAIPRTNLRRPSDTFVGRQPELQLVGELLGSRRVTTIWGGGGFGKTRLAIEAGWARLEVTDDDVWFIDLVAVEHGTAEEHIWEAIGSGAGLPRSPGVSARELVIGRATTRQSVFVLDNCEHVLASVAPVASELVQRAPSARVIATSREPLGAPARRSSASPRWDPARQSDPIRWSCSATASRT